MNSASTSTATVTTESDLVSVVSSSSFSSSPSSTTSHTHVHHDDDDVEAESLLSNSKGVNETHSHTKVTTHTHTVTQPISKQQQQLPIFHYFSLAAFWFGWSFLWLPLLVVMVPTQILQFVDPSQKGEAQAHTVLLGSAVSLIAAPLFGSLSDSCTHPAGRRRPFMIVGTIIASVALILMSVAWNLSSFSMGFFLLSLGNNMILSPYSALVPDTVPFEQRGTASGWLGCMSMFGYLFGGAVSFYVDVLGTFPTYCVLILVHAAAMAFTCYWVREVTLTEATCVAPRGCGSRVTSMVAPMLHRDFRILFFTRFLMQMGIVTVQQSLLFYLADVIVTFDIGGQVFAQTPQQAASILFVPILFGSILSSLVAGIVSD